MNEEHDAENIQKPEKKLGGPGKPARRQMSAGDTKKVREVQKRWKCTVCCPTPKPQPT